MSNATLPLAPVSSKRSGRFTSSRVGAATLPVEDIRACDPPSLHHDGSNISVFDILGSHVEVPEPALTQLGFSRASGTRKNGNWTNGELAEAIAAYDNGMSIKKASEKFRIPYNSFREHFYGLRKSRNRDAKGTLSTDEEQQPSNWLISMVERGYGLIHSALKMKVNEITMSKKTPFQNGIPGAGG